MDRQIVYAGSIPLDTDLLNIQRYVQRAIGALAQMVLGSTLNIDGLVCSPGALPYSVVIGPGSFTAPLQIDNIAFGALPPDPSVVMQTALHLDTTTLQLGPPSEADQVLCWLVQASITEVDGGPVALPYWNAGNPGIAFSGPGNSGLAQNTQRLVRVALACKASGPEVFPVGTPPAADAGWVGLYAVTTFADKPAIEAGDIIETADSPSLSFKLPVLPPGATRQDIFSYSSIWRAPPGVRRVRIRLVGGGGGGGGGDSDYSGGGGGAGGYSELLTVVLPGHNYSITVGAAGAPGSPGVTAGAGGDSDFAGLAHATGGQGGGAGNPDSHGGIPGQGTAGGLLQTGGWGGDGTGLAKVPGGNGGASAFGGGGRGAFQVNIPDAGQAAGAGGGGGYGPSSNGESGSRGLVIVEY